jgi:ribosomal protein S18 acetylase RimI-like enzyme
MTPGCDGTTHRGEPGPGYTPIAVPTDDPPTPDAPDDPAPGIVVSEATEASPELLASMRRLVPQLSSSAAPLRHETLAEIVNAPSVILLVAHDAGGRLVGTLSLVVFRAPTGLRAWIEDVVVDGEARGTGTGAALVRHALERARRVGAETVDLTSRPSREAANRLYRREGFAERTTNVYRFSFERPGPPAP